jgi:chemotaxis protein histidine kinase CheA/ActR/RegA family two-component response regulator
MSTSPDYDTGPLNWVRGDIDAALQAALGHVQAYSADADLANALRLAHDETHQATGALSMVGLEGAATLSGTLESCLTDINENRLPASDEMLRALRNALEGLQRWVRDVADGRGSGELALFPLYKRLRELQGAERVFEGELFFPDLRTRIKGKAVNEALPQEALAAAVKAARSQFQRGLLGFLRNAKAEQGLCSMRDALVSIEQVAPSQASRTFWWACVGFVESLIAHGVEADFHVKQLLARIDLQMRRLMEGSPQVAERLLRDALFFVAKSQSIDGYAADVRKTFGLDRYLPGRGMLDPETLARMRPVLEALQTSLKAARDSWLAYVEGNAEQLEQFQALLERMHPQAQALAESGLLALLNTLSAAAGGAAARDEETREQMNLEVASTLLFMQNGVSQEDVLHADYAIRAENQRARLQALIDGRELPDAVVESSAQREAERDMLVHMAQEVGQNLKQMESALEAFFNDADEREGLASLPGLSQQAQGALTMLELDDGANLLAAATALMQPFANEGHPDEATQQRLADAFSSLGLYIESYCAGRADADKILRPVLALFGVASTSGDDEDGFDDTVESGMPGRKAEVKDAYLEWREQPGSETKKKYLDALTELSRDAELVDDDLLKQQTRAALDVSREADMPPSSLDAALAALTGLALPERLATSEDSDATAAMPQPAIELSQEEAPSLTPITFPSEPGLAETAAPAEVVAEIELLPAETDGQPEVLEPISDDHATVDENSLQTSIPEGVEPELLEIFLEEAGDVLTAIDEAAETCHANPDDHEALTIIRRGFHTLKGSGRMVGLTDLGETAWHHEQLMNAWLAENKPASDDLLHLVDTARGVFQDWVHALQANQPAALPVPVLLAAVDRVAHGQPFEMRPVAMTPPAEPVEIAEHVPEAAFDFTLGAVDETGLETEVAATGLSIELPSLDAGAESPVESLEAAEHAPEAVFDFTLGAVDETGLETEAAATELSIELPSLDAGAESPVESLEALDEAAFDFTLGAVDETGLETEAAATEPPIELPALEAFVESPEETERALVTAFEPVSDGGSGIPEEESALQGEAALRIDESSVLVPGGESSGAAAVIEYAHVAEPLAAMPEETPEAPPEVMETVEVSERVAEMAGADQDEKVEGDFGRSSPAVNETETSEQDAQNELAATPAEDEICIGSVCLSKGLYEVFITEVHQRLQVLQTEVDHHSENPHSEISEHARRAVHTLAGVASTAGFASLADLAHALEHYWNSREHRTLPQTSLPLIQDAAERLQIMVATIEAGYLPGPATDLILGLSEAQAEVDDISAGIAAPVAVVKEKVDSEPASPVSAPEVANSVERVQAAVSAAGLDVNALPEFKAATPAPVFERREVADEIDEQLLPIFLEEAENLVPDTSAQLRAWKAAPASSAARDALRRNLHTIKGSARMVGAMRLGELTHVMESRVVAVIEGHMPADSEVFDTLEAQVDRLADTVERLKQGDLSSVVEDVEAPLAAPVEPVLSPAPGMSTADAASRATDQPATRDSNAATLRVRADWVDRMVNQAGEVAIARSRIESEVFAFKRHVAELSEALARLRGHIREVEIQAESQMQATFQAQGVAEQQFDPLEFDRFTRFQEVTRFLAESVNDISTVQHILLARLGEADAALIEQTRLNRELQQDLLRVRMVPLYSVAERLYRTVRQTARDVSKRAQLDIQGGELEIDRSVLEKVTAPLEHLLRNALAHGIETPEQRLASGKPEFGEIVLTARQSGNEMMLTVKDDGAGLNYARIREKAEANGLLSPGVEPTETLLAQMILAAGFSTADAVSQVAGRGVGMDVVKSEISALGGRIEISSMAGMGTCFDIYLPLTLAMSQAVMVQAGRFEYALPTPLVQQVLELKPAELEQAMLSGEVVWRGVRYPFTYLPHILGETEAVHELQRYNPVLLLQSGTSHAAVMVDVIEGTREIVVKNIGPQMARITGVAGATVRGDGRVLLILNPVPLAIRWASQPRSMTERAAPAESFEVSAALQPPLVLVVDDSLTVRKITTRLLTREGYRVDSAKDGVDALEKMGDLIPDIVLLDVEMPRMDGFELARVMRSDERLKSVPIIMITSRTADKHRNHALELGVNVYLGKPYQEQQLLENIASQLEHKGAVQV